VLYHLRYPCRVFKLIRDLLNEREVLVVETAVLAGATGTR
jgi:hypothetical protein